MRRTSSPEPPVTIEPPLVQGRWRLVRTLETHPLGAVFLAWDNAARAWCAVEIAREESGVRRLKRERSATEALQHAAIDRIHLIGADGPIVYAVRRYLRGDALALAPMAVGHALRLVLEAADALAHAHDRRQVHGALRPDRLRFDADGRPVVTGWADRLEPATDPHRVAHLAPEVRAGLPPDERADVYALGATLYTLVAGRGRADLHLDALAALPSRLRTVVTAACARDPASRPRTATEMHDWLVTRLGSMETSEREPWGPKRLPVGPPPTVVADAPLAGMARLLTQRTPGIVSRDLRTPSPDSNSGTLDPDPLPPRPTRAARSAVPSSARTPLPYTMKRLVRKDPGFRDPYAPVDPMDLPSYADPSASSEPAALRERRPPAPGTPRPPPAPRAWLPSTGPSGAARLALAALVGLGSALAAGVPVAAWWLEGVAREAEAGHALVDAVLAEEPSIAPLAASAADPAPLRRAWFVFADAPSPQGASEVVRQAAALDHDSLDPALREAIARLREAEYRWERAHP